MGAVMYHLVVCAVRGAPMTRTGHGVTAFAAMWRGAAYSCKQIPLHSPTRPHVPQAIQRPPPLPLPLPADKTIAPPHTPPVHMHPPPHMPSPPHTLPLTVPSRAAPRYLSSLGMHRVRTRQGGGCRGCTAGLCRAEGMEKVERVFKGLSGRTAPRPCTSACCFVSLHVSLIADIAQHYTETHDPIARERQKNGEKIVRFPPL